ncbi:MAG: dTMP kinase [Thermoflexaceae bacterium]|nr:dTMP kinase [Thermoflexaceae bacterium]
MSGRFIVFEGGEGAGKTTVTAAVGRRLAHIGHEVVLTREPGGTPAGERVRALLHENLVPWGEAFAFLVARAQIVHELIQPALDRGAIVLCDRYAASTFAYQGYARGLDLATLRAANAAVTNGLEPELTVWLDLEPAVGLARKLGEAESIRTGLESVAFHERVRDGYRRQMEEAAPGSWVRINAAQPLVEVEMRAWEAITGARLPGT